MVARGIGGKDIVMSIPEPYQGIEYSVSNIGGDRWRWTLHPKLESGVAGRIESGEVSGTQDDAIEAAKAAIDKMDKSSN